MGGEADWKLRLYVERSDEASERIIGLLHELCVTDNSLPLQLEVIDLKREPMRISEIEASSIPCLLRTSPLPRKWVGGDLTDPEFLAIALNLSYIS